MPEEDINDCALFTPLTPEEASAVSGGNIIIAGKLIGGSVSSIPNTTISTIDFARASSSFARKYLPSWMWPAADNFWQ